MEKSERWMQRVKDVTTAPKSGGRTKILKHLKWGAARGTGGDHRQVLRLYVLPRRRSVGLPDTIVSLVPVDAVPGKLKGGCPALSFRYLSCSHFFIRLLP